jgi:hypothetical protein
MSHHIHVVAVESDQNISPPSLDGHPIGEGWGGGMSYYKITLQVMV